MKAFSRMPGKIILFGEHAVVHGRTGIACSVDVYSEASVESSDELVVDNRGVTRESVDGLLKAYERISSLPPVERASEVKRLSAANGNAYVNYIIGSFSRFAELRPMRIRIRSDLRKSMGTSASVFASLASALSEFYGLSLSKEQINSIAYEGEILAHGGTPSGIDNSTVVYGGYVKFRKDTGPKPLDIDFEMPIVIGDTKTKPKTSVTVPMVNRLVEKNSWAKESIERIDEISNKALEALRKKDISEIGSLMNENHEELKKLKLSTPELEELVRASLDAGALGAKISGGGGGGIMIALAADRKIQEKIAKAMESAGYDALMTMIG